jgi:hypothetical protein
MCLGSGTVPEGVQSKATQIRAGEMMPKSGEMAQAGRVCGADANLAEQQLITTKELTKS